MKKILMTLVMLVALSTAVFANGPLLGFSTIPAAPAVVGLTFGYDFGDINLELWKLNLTTPAGTWVTGLIWTPSDSSFEYRLGAKLLLDYNGFVSYNGFGFVLGVSKAWGPIELYGEFDIMPFGVLVAVPVVGVNFLFGDLIPDVVE